VHAGCLKTGVAGGGGHFAYKGDDRQNKMGRKDERSKRGKSERKMWGIEWGGDRRKSGVAVRLRGDGRAGFGARGSEKIVGKRDRVGEKRKAGVCSLRQEIGVWLSARLKGEVGGVVARGDRRKNGE